MNKRECEHGIGIINVIKAQSRQTREEEFENEARLVQRITEK